MTEVRDPASMIEAAQKAVGDGDYLAAERLLREAAAIQEASLGSSHPDLASTLNNLAFVCERTGNSSPRPSAGIGGPTRLRSPR